MKKISAFLFVAVSLLAVSLNNITLKAQGVMTPDSIVMSANYANEAYYNMSSGVILSGPRATWDIAFRTMKMSSSIITNDGAGVVLYTYPKADTTGWATLDTNGLSTWAQMFNDPTDWENGAFSRHATGHPDYGWGKYNDVTHNLTGDSIFVIKLRDGIFKKLWIVKKLSAANIYIFKYANLDGSDEQIITQDLNAQIATDFYGFSLQTNEPVGFQPPKADWDILFTKYVSVQSNGSPYPVIGVLSKEDVKVKHFHPVPLSYSDFGAGTWDSTRSKIGWNWKIFDMKSFSYIVPDTNVYFVKPESGDIYKLYFTGFAGASTGLIKFSVERAAGAGIGDSKVDPIQLTVYPNPAVDRIHINATGSTGEDLTFILTDLTGRQLRADRPGRMADGRYAYSMDVTGVQPGIYFVTVSTAATQTVTKVIITR